MSESPITHWKKVRFTPIPKALSPRMLDQGVLETKNAYLRNAPIKSFNRQPRILSVLYDLSYVHYRVAEIINQLDMTKPEFKRLVDSLPDELVEKKPKRVRGKKTDEQ